ncbi:conjugal transfer protein TraA [Janthinobacterium sp. ROICE36]|uniref:MobQ family relaxase n=1 Tax=Janthinobacterium sp. ROICE36 TaxID=2048670 RepID=UPI000C7EFA7A|nr:MobQ family relaxase [Janthinobacterium sp. ROICE36]PLY39462.1 conjugal transfer protein TraA [Janthinobacterium sp. ROICE36]
MAIYHLSVKQISRSAGRSSTAAAAYRAGCEIADKRTGEVHDYTRKGGIASTDMVLPDGAPEWAKDRSALWNAAEAAERRKDACVAREFEVALPDELSPEERRRLAVDFAKEMANAEGCAVDVSIHAPGKEGDSRNHHAHILRTTRKVGPDGLTDKLNTEKAGRNRAADLDAVRTRWAVLTNERLRENGIDAQVDHRSLKDQGIDRIPTSHLGPFVTGMERRGVRTEVSKRINDEVAQRLAQAHAQGIAERELSQINRSVIDLSGDLSAAKREVKSAELAEIVRTATLARQAMEQAKAKDAAARQAELERVAAQAKTELVSGAAAFRARFMADRAAKIEADRRAELAQQAAERAKVDAARKVEQERIAAQEREEQRNPKKDQGPGWSR